MIKLFSTRQNPLLTTFSTIGKVTVQDLKRKIAGRFGESIQRAFTVKNTLQAQEEAVSVYGEVRHVFQGVIVAERSYVFPEPDHYSGRE